MTMQKKRPLEIPNKTRIEEDDYYAIEKKRIAEEAQKAHKIHELEVQEHITQMIPYYDEAEGEERRSLLLLNNLLINRFEEPGMMYWNIFRNAPTEIHDYADLFGEDLTAGDIDGIVRFLEQKKEESESMVDMGFDEDGEEDENYVDVSENFSDRGDGMDEEEERE